MLICFILATVQWICLTRHDFFGIIGHTETISLLSIISKI